MTKDETQIYNTLLALVEQYDSANTTDQKTALYRKINHVSACEVDKDFLDSYWKSMNLDEFCQIHSVIKEEKSGKSEADIRNYLVMIVSSLGDSDALDYNLTKYSDAIEYYFKKNTGTLIDLIEQQDLTDIDALLEALKKPDIINL